MLALEIIGASANLRNAAISVVRSVRPSVHLSAHRILLELFLRNFISGLSF
jgi:hypothetical protein